MGEPYSKGRTEWTWNGWPEHHVYVVFFENGRVTGTWVE